jgi:two-component system cell cycle sensor histidine kinase/response regulator CckA
MTVRLTPGDNRGNSAFAHEIEALKQRVAVLQRRAAEGPLPAAEALPDAFEELQTALEELRVVEEELLQQNEELTATRQGAEAERQRYQELFDFAPDGYLVTDAAGIIQEANRAVAALLAVPQSWLLGKPLVAFVAQGECWGFHTHLSRLRQQEGVQNWEVHLKPRRGIPCPVSITLASVRDPQGTLVGLRWLLRDITARKRTELALQQTHAELETQVAERTADLARLEAEISGRQQLEEELIKARKLESLGVLAGGIAHDFNNLLTAILGNVSLAKMLADPHEKIVAFLTKAESACQQATTLTQQLLTFAKGGAPVRQTASIMDLITESTDFALRGSNVRCVFSFADDLWSVEVDQGQGHQVLHNVLINADQAMPHGGIIHMRAENLSVDADCPLPLRQGRYIKISVSDQGCGILAEHLPNIFDPYFTTKERGSGLGLATAYAVVTKHEGYIRVESEVGVGTTFSIYLPASYGVCSTEQDGAARLLSGQGKILVMDDDNMVRELVSNMLTSLGYEVEEACDGAEAIALYQSAQEAGQPFTAVILDVTIPGAMGGKDAIATLRVIDPQVKAIVSSGYSDDPVMANFRQYGFSGVVAKPYTVQGLSDVLQRVMLNNA